MTEASLYPAIIGEYSTGPTRLWRQQSGLAWQGTVIEHTRQRLILGNPRAIRSGMPGISDLGGITSVVIEEQHLGRTFGLYVAIECKSANRRATAEQAAFIAAVKRLGGRSGVCASVSGAGRIIDGHE